ncbi:class B sortase [Gracilibacillus sp. S3-1-1]|uniref:Class B sortase n=1 Tax=Gracilibacillus pellucidus TaxID=3095368 RepID=A0ACC6M3P0_9BACI|nr:class B sortase [Gracilibacillus sp. S3-1-1]MDX8045579.1 class B sortase [Gracilibacillus sp. S3-1-1]
MNQIGKKFYYSLLMISLVGIGYSLYFLIIQVNDYAVAQHKYGEIKTMYHQQERSLENINEDYIGWISIENTSIDYPVVLSSDNQYYLDHNFYQEEDFVGSIFMDYRNSVNPMDQHTIIYGHNMKDKSMFGSLSDIINDPSFADYQIKLEVDGKLYVWEIFSAYVSTKTDWMQVFFQTPTAYDDFLENILDSSMQPSSQDLNKMDRIITLATCTTNGIDERFIVHGKLVEESS